MNQRPQASEAELEAFRQRWRDEVSARQKAPSAQLPSTTRQAKPTQSTPVTAAPGPSTARRKDVVDAFEDIEPRAYHDLPDNEERLELGVDGQERRANPEPNSALEHYELAVEKETQGQLGDSLRAYQKAFKLDDGVHEAYKRKHHPPSSFANPKPTNPYPSNASATVPNPAHHSLPDSTSNAALPATLQQLIEDLSTLRIEPKEPEASLSPQDRCLLAELPEEILTQILTALAIADVASFARLAQVCKRLAFLVLTEETIWRRVAVGPEVGFAAMHYDYACTIEGRPLEPDMTLDQFSGTLDNASEDPQVLPPPTPESLAAAFSTQTLSLLHTTYASSWRELFRSRPRVRFNGCYISTVNYVRAGGNATNTLTWGATAHIVTYYRYLRFFRDGTVISLLSTNEPAEVVHHLTKENLKAHAGAVQGGNHHGNFHAASTALPSSVMRDALRGRWRLMGPAHTAVPASSSHPEDSPEAEVGSEGTLHIETEGVNRAKYLYRMHLAVTHAGRRARNNKLAWRGFWSQNRLTDDWGEFGLRNDRGFVWSRVRRWEG